MNDGGNGYLMQMIPGSLAAHCLPVFSSRTLTSYPGKALVADPAFGLNFSSNPQKFDRMGDPDSVCQYVSLTNWLGNSSSNH